ncbi:nucleotidyltransferase [Leptolyngbya sp. FACHB-541]|uniref:nucleotide-binding domain-containing protein n=1 Tax=Leptolyngbya sp. FACHB-541 TaxID=2692810 RepID=UPI001681CCF1|nr:nucleotidyltransferase [Leptolyngbya sp. FACHB-541]
MFNEFLSNLAIDNADKISDRYGEVTASLNKKFRDTESKTANSLQVGSIGRKTAIKGISDLDMLYIMPKGMWSDYKDGKQYKLLSDAKDAIKVRYPNTKVFVDRLVVCVQYTNFHIEVQPVFEQDDGSFKYPDTYGDGSWKITKPREEIEAMSEFDVQKNSNLQQLCKMARAWKNKHGVGMGGLLIDTLAYNFLKSTTDYDNKSHGYYDVMSRDFFTYLMDQPNQDYYAALGSNQRVRVKKKFQRKAKKTYKLCVEAIEAGEQDIAHDKWKKVYGRPFPNRPVTNNDVAAASQPIWRNTEQFIEDKFAIDIRYNITIDCDISQNGFRESSLSEFLRKQFRLARQKNLKFYIKDHDIEGNHSIYWKVLNRGQAARKRDMIRGQIFPDSGSRKNFESTDFRGHHIVECYAVKNGIVVAEDRIDVPIE